MEEITFEHIIRYLENGLSDDERRHLESLVRVDSVLAGRIEEAKQLLKGIHRAGEKEVEENVKSFHVEFKKSNAFLRLSGKLIPFNIASRRLKWVALAASILLLFFVGYSFFKTSPEQKLFAQYKTEESIFIKNQIEYLERAGMASNDKEKRNELRQGLTAYQNKDYPKGVSTLSEYVKRYPTDSIAILYLGLSKLSMEKFPEAETNLKKLLDSPNAEIRDVSGWYLALLNIRSKRYEKAGLLLESIVQNPTSLYKVKAESLLTEINRK